MLASPLAAQGRGRTVVTGQVVDAGTGVPITAVELQVAGTRMVAPVGRDGRFRIGLRQGTHGLVFSRMGYEDRIVAVEVGSEPVDLGEIRLNTDVIMLEALRVSVDRLERIRRASAFASNTYGVEELSRQAWMDAPEFLSSRAGLFALGCGALSPEMTRECILHRGQLVKVCVMMDDMPVLAGLSGLAGYQVRDFARINVYRRGAFVQVYTPEYLVRLAQKHYRPMSVQLQMMSYCQSNVGRPMIS